MVVGHLRKNNFFPDTRRGKTEARKKWHKRKKLPKKERKDNFFLFREIAEMPSHGFFILQRAKFLYNRI